MSTSRLPSTLPDFEAAAGAAIDAGAFGYLNGGATDEWTLSANVAAWRRLPIVPRVLTCTGQADTAVAVLGEPMPHPIIAAPMAYQRIATPDGEIAMARAAAQTSTTVCVSTLSTVSATEIAEAVPEARRWFQAYVFTDRGLTHSLIESAVASGYSALVVTVDLPVSGLRERDIRSGYRVNHAVPAVAAAGTEGSFEPHRVEHLIDAHLTWTDIGDFASRYPVPVLVKGIMSADDALLAFEHGAAGVVVSNHGGRQLDGVAATAAVLGGIVDAVDGRGDVLVDGGIRRGTDILRALALGANAVLVGRPLFWGLAVGGASGAQRVLELFLEEFSNALILSGANSARSLGRDFLLRDAGVLRHP